MTTTDTRAAIHAAIRDLFLGSSTPAVARVTIDAAITAHVEAEVARRLAAAPGVEEAIDNLVMAQRHVVESELADHVNRSAAVIHDAEADRGDAEKALRAAVCAECRRLAEPNTAPPRGES